MSVPLTRTRRRVLTKIVNDMVVEKRREARDVIDREMAEDYPQRNR
jgi:hypothetical protein